MTVRRFDPRSGGEVDMALRYLPAMLAPDREGAFRAVGIPISLALRGKIRELEPHRRLVLELTLTLDRAGAGIETTTRLDLEPVPEGTQVKLTVSGKTNPHWATLGQANLEGQLDRLGRSLGRASEAPL